MPYTHQKLEQDFRLDFTCVSTKEKNILGFRRDHESPSCLCDESGNIIAIIVHDKELKEVSISSELQSLQYLNLAECNIAFITFEEGLSRLEHLDLSENSIEGIAFSSGFDTLKWLDLSRNKNLQSVTWESGMSKLEYLDFSDNAIKSLDFPRGFTNLKYCYLRANQIRDIAVRGRFPALSILDVRKNQLEYFPENIMYHSKKLETLYLHESGKIANISPSYHASGERDNAISKDIMGYFQSIRNTDKQIENDEVKLVLLGNSTAGKTTLVKYFLNRHFDDQLASTHGINNEYWEPENRPVKVNIWDFGGQEYYHATHRLFLSKNTVVLVLFNEKTNHQGVKPEMVKNYDGGVLKEGLEDIEHFHYEYWLKSYKHFADVDATENCLVIQTKMDEKGTKEVEFTDEIKKEFGLNNKNQKYISVLDAANGDSDALDTFGNFERALLKMLESTKSGFLMNEDWITIKERIIEKRSTTPYMGREEFKELCEEVSPNIAVEKEGTSPFAALLRDFHEIGCIYYPNIEGLRNKVFIEPKWLTDIIYRILDKKVKKERGRFSKEHIEKVIEDYSKHENRPIGMNVDELVKIMENFNLVCQVDMDGEIEYVAPQYLEEDLDKDTKANAIDKCVQHIFTLHFPHFLPRSVMTELICLYGKTAVRGSVSKSSIILRDAEEKPVLVERLEDKYIRVTADIRVSDYFLAELYHRLDKINDNHRDTQVTIDRQHFVNVQKLKMKSLDRKMIEDTTGKKDIDFAPFRFLCSHTAEMRGGEDHIHELKSYRGLDFDKLPKLKKEMNVFEEIRDLIGKARLEQALEKLENAAQGTDHATEATGLKSQLSKLNSKDRMNILSNSESVRERNGITIAALELVGVLEKDINSGKKKKDRQKQTLPILPKDKKIRLLFIAVTAPGTKRIRHEEEISDLLKNKSNSENPIEILIKDTASMQEVIQAIANFEPNIIHFSMHGKEDEGLAFTNKYKNEMEIVDASKLKELLEYQMEDLPDLTTLVFNACHSHQLAKATSELGLYCIGTEQKITNAAATAFSYGFYDIYINKHTKIKKAVRAGISQAMFIDSDAKDFIKLYFNGKKI